jgi:hypothetical protein
MKLQTLIFPALALVANAALFAGPGFGAAPTHRLTIKSCQAPSPAILDQNASLIGRNADKYREYMTLCPVRDSKGRVSLQILALKWG